MAYPCRRRLGRFWLGDGGLTLALADCSAGRKSTRSTRAHSLERRSAWRSVPRAQVTYLAADYTRPLDLPPLDGIVWRTRCTSSVQNGALARRSDISSRVGGSLVEYNSDHGNMWVPYPLSFPTWETLASATAVQTRLLATTPSRFLREIYSAESEAQE